MPGVPPPLIDQNAQDASHLDGLAIAHYVVGGLIALFACFPLIHLSMGLFFLFGNFDQQAHGSPDEFVGLIFVVVGAFMFLLGQTMAVCTILSGRSIKARSKYTFSFVIACLLCAAFPFGTVLGVLTLIVLCRPSVKALYGQ